MLFLMEHEESAVLCRSQVMSDACLAFASPLRLAWDLHVALYDMFLNGFGKLVPRSDILTGYNPFLP
jgi:hypothetical protein